MLRYIEKYDGSNRLRIVPSGIYDDITRDAVLDIQKKNSLAETGITDQATFAAIRLEYDRLTLENSPPLSINVFEGYTLTPGEKSDLVYILQIMLNTLREKYDFIPLLPISGSYNADTMSSVSAFKEAHGMAPDPYVDKLTWDMLALEYNLSRRQ